jgi:hypothetical protein
MGATVELAEFGYRYIPGPFQYSAGVAALPGHRVERLAFARRVPLAEGFARIEAHLRARGLPTTAFCACELRSPAPFTDEGFKTFNRLYVGTLERWGIVKGDANPVARSNVCPERDKPDGPSFHAFCLCVPADGEAGGFVVAGSGEAREGEGSYRSRTVRPGETGAEALRDKAAFVLDEMERRLAALDAGWARTSAVQAYTVYDLHPFLADEIVRRGAARDGLTWHYARPPVIGLDYEMDCRRVPVERLLEV